MVLSLKLFKAILVLEFNFDEIYDNFNVVEIFKFGRNYS